MASTNEFLRLYKRYAQQLTIGCGSKDCNNVGYCATNRLLRNGLESAMDISFANAMALHLATDASHLCAQPVSLDPISVEQLPSPNLNFAKLQQPFKSAATVFKQIKLPTTAVELVFKATDNVTAAKSRILEALSQQDGRLPALLVSLQPFHQPAVLAGAITAIIQLGVFKRLAASSVLSMAGDLLAALSQEVNALLRDEFASLESPLRLNYVLWLRSCLDLYHASYPNNVILNALALMTQLHQVNETHPDPIPAGSFISSPLCQNLEAKSILMHWIEAVDAQPSPLSLLAPRLSFLKDYHSLQPKPTHSFLDYPFVLATSFKRELLRIEAATEMSREFQQSFYVQAFLLEAEKLFQVAESRPNARPSKCKVDGVPYLLLQVRRGNEVEDVFNALAAHPQTLRKPLKVRYIGSGEQGLDMGGVQKELLQEVWETLSKPDYGLFTEQPQSRWLYFNSSDTCASNRHFEMAGMVLGLAAFNGVLLNLKLPEAFYKVLLGLPVSLKDYADYAPTQAKSLQTILTYEGDLEDLCQMFSVTEQSTNGMYEVELVPQGCSMAVTNESKHEFVRYYVNYKLKARCQKQLAAFRQGFLTVAGGRVLKLVTPQDLKLLLCGVSELNFLQLKAGAVYEDYTADHPTIQMFWNVVLSFDEEEKRLFLAFVTGSDREPISGLASIKLCVQRNGLDSDRLPTSLTCFSRLLLPEYTTQDRLEDRLKLAIHNTHGFGLV
eukprot:m.119585 g.119585  ORF g.119585 m.119585 type:complete len:725 (-) comp15598_c0_seq3:912-3086(-)